ncbi:MAG TPA: 2TM domain-containing protein, partial [Candidatus Baltobacteraceae bacterium]|nr:2TM domain-containing protein [Candidatus Baltobacteraceae bacterium]
RRDFSSNIVSYIVVNAALLLVWYFTGRGYFWPAWILWCWGVGLLLHAWTIWGRKPITEDDVRRERARLQPR